MDSDMNLEFTPDAAASLIDIGPLRVEPHQLILLVVGGHLESEALHRPRAELLASRLRERIEPGCQVVTLTDLWYLNDDRLRACPALSIGGPRVNALTTYLGDKIPTVFAVDDQYQIQLDLETRDPVGAIWGIDGPTTISACDIFEEKYLSTFVEMVRA